MELESSLLLHKDEISDLAATNINPPPPPPLSESPHILSDPNDTNDRKCFSNSLDRTGGTFDDILVLNTTPNAHDISTPAISEVDPKDKIQLFPYFILFC